MTKNELAKMIYQASHLDGNFVLRSGQVSKEYFDKYLFEAEPRILVEIGIQMAGLIPEGTEIIAGLEMGGIPIATTLSLQTGIMAAFVRKKAKEYGTYKLAEGGDIRGKNVCIIEDVVTTGGQILLSAADLRRFGAEVKYVLCVIERDSKSRINLKEKGLELISLFTLEDLKPN
jgi:orotate phosphoribosyltransferase